MYYNYLNSLGLEQKLIYEPYETAINHFQKTWYNKLF